MRVTGCGSVTSTPSKALGSSRVYVCVLCDGMMRARGERGSIGSGLGDQPQRPSTRARWDGELATKGSREVANANPGAGDPIECCRSRQRIAAPKEKPKTPYARACVRAA